MTDTKHPLSNDPQDGFDLIEYPCDYGFKAMCRVAQFNSQDASEVIRSLVLNHVLEDAFLGIKTKQSRTGKFESVTVDVRLTDRAELEAIYKSIANSPIVVMTL
jgi:putative lipoic acid-binding regulatory protein